MFDLIGDSEIAIKKANKKKSHELLNKLGSSGCIDLAKHELEFFNKLKKYGRDMIINVKYPKEKLR